MDASLPKESKSYSDSMQDFVTDPDLLTLQSKYEPYLLLHRIEDILNLFDIVKTTLGGSITGKLIWKTDRDLPIELKRDILKVYEKHF